MSLVTRRRQTSRAITQRLARAQDRIAYHKSMLRQYMTLVWGLKKSLEWKILELLADKDTPQFGVTLTGCHSLLKKQGVRAGRKRVEVALRRLISHGFLRKRSKPEALTPEEPFSYYVLNARLPEWADNDPGGMGRSQLLDPAPLRVENLY